eukprot:1957311-Pleurochrysis_carterae.AAC.1
MLCPSSTVSINRIQFTRLPLSTLLSIWLYRPGFQPPFKPAPARDLWRARPPALHSQPHCRFLLNQPITSLSHLSFSPTLIVS